ncbi:MAG: cache and HAMP domain-containing protein, partial [Gammaproteobacteria bacterium]|nr:cache and HAMP domain-containing protein [Gammaproteobacteria bacterium]
MTSLVVTGVSVHLVEDFVQSKVEKTLHTLLGESAVRIETWYRNRFDEVEVFADAKILYQSLTSVTDNRAQIDQYLHNVENNLPNITALFLLDSAGRISGWAGDEFALPPTLLLILSNVQSIGISDLLTLPPGQLQIISAPVTNPSGSHVGTLHAVLDTRPLMPLLDASNLSSSGRFILVDGRTKPILSSSHRQEPPHYDLPVDRFLIGGPGLKKYQNSHGEWIVGTSLEIPMTRQVLILEESYAKIFDPVTQILYKTLFINLAVVTLFGIAALLVARSIIRPIDTLATSVQRIAQGDPDALPDTLENGEVGVLTNAINMMMEKLES